MTCGSKLAITASAMTAAWSSLVGVGDRELHVNEAATAVAADEPV
jgi:hypothetical protein